MNQWQPIDQAPDVAGWYATCKQGDKLSTPRYFDDLDGSWWLYSNHQDNQTLVPNNSFDMWARLPLPPILRDPTAA